MFRALIGVALVVVVAAIVVIVAASREQTAASEPSTSADTTAAAVRDFQAAGNRMTPDGVMSLLGKPDEVYRNNPRALCWRYSGRYMIKMCWGPKRQQAWIAHNIPGAEPPP